MTEQWCYGETVTVPNNSKKQICKLLRFEVLTLVCGLLECGAI